MNFSLLYIFYKCKQMAKSLGINYPVLNFYRLCNYNHTLYLNNHKSASKHYPTSIQVYFFTDKWCLKPYLFVFHVQILFPFHHVLYIWRNMNRFVYYRVDFTLFPAVTWTTPQKLLNKVISKLLNFYLWRLRPSVDTLIHSSKLYCVNTI